MNPLPNAGSIAGSSTGFVDCERALCATNPRRPSAASRSELARATGVLPMDEVRVIEVPWGHRRRLTSDEPGAGHVVALPVRH
jgi:hypothetical protein